MIRKAVFASGIGLDIQPAIHCYGMRNFVGLGQINIIDGLAFVTKEMIQPIIYRVGHDGQPDPSPHAQSSDQNSPTRLGFSPNSKAQTNVDSPDLFIIMMSLCNSLLNPSSPLSGIAICVPSDDVKTLIESRSWSTQVAAHSPTPAQPKSLSRESSTILLDLLASRSARVSSFPLSFFHWVLKFLHLSSIKLPAKSCMYH